MDDSTKVVNAIWEKRNLGVDTFEVTVPESTPISILVETISKFGPSDHIVLKVPKGNIGLIHKAEDLGFRFTETQFKISRGVRSFSNESDNPQIKAAAKISLQPIQDYSDQSFLLLKINENMFVNDRIALDPAFGIIKSGLRYKNWLSDAFKKNDGEVYFLTIKNGTRVGFVYLKQSNNIMDIILGGIFPEFKGMGLGTSIVAKPLQLAYERGAQTICTSISSNNIEILRLYFTLGYQINNIYYVLRKING